MEKTTMTKLASVVVILLAFLVAATQEQLTNMVVAFGIAAIASVGIWMQPPTDLGNWKKLTDHLLLSLPIAGLAVVAGAVVYSTATGLDLQNAVGLFVLVFVPANVLEQYFLAQK